MEEEKKAVGLFLLVSSDRTGGNGHKVKCRKFHVIVGLTKPKEIVESPGGTFNCDWTGP